MRLLVLFHVIYIGVASLSTLKCDSYMQDVSWKAMIVSIKSSSDCLYIAQHRVTITLHNTVNFNPYTVFLDKVQLCRKKMWTVSMLKLSPHLFGWYQCLTVWLKFESLIASKWITLPLYVQCNMYQGLKFESYNQTLAPSEKMGTQIWEYCSQFLRTMLNLGLKFENTVHNFKDNAEPCTQIWDYYCIMSFKCDNTASSRLKFETYISIRMCFVAVKVSNLSWRYYFALIFAWQTFHFSLSHRTYYFI